MNRIATTAGLLAMASIVSTALVAPFTGASATTRDAASATSHIRILATLELGHHTVEFVDDGSGVIGVGEDAPSGVPTLLGQLTHRDVSALEIFEALAPDKTAPAALQADHKRTAKLQGRTSMAPMDLGLTLPPSAAPGAGSEEWIGGACNYQDAFIGESQWAQDWYFDHEDKDARDQATYYLEDLNGNTGKQWSAGKSRARWLGACNGEFIFGFDAFQFTATYKAWDGTFKPAYFKQVQVDHQIVYFSFGGSEQWRVKLSEISYNVFLDREYGVAVAKNDPFGFTTGN